MQLNMSVSQQGVGTSSLMTLSQHNIIELTPHSWQLTGSAHVRPQIPRFCHFPKKKWREMYKCTSSSPAVSDTIHRNLPAWHNHPWKLVCSTIWSIQQTYQKISVGEIVFSSSLESILACSCNFLGNFPKKLHGNPRGAFGHRQTPPECSQSDPDLSPIPGPS